MLFVDLFSKLARDILYSHTVIAVERGQEIYDIYQDIVLSARSLEAIKTDKQYNL
jgi:hypothetical protein